MNNKGYTLIEIMVAVSIFVIVIASPTGFLVSSLKQQQKALAMQELTDNISYNLEYMSKALRMAGDGDCSFSSDSNYEITTRGIKFNDYNGNCKEFYLDNGKLYETSGLPGDQAALTPDSIAVTNFKVNGTGLPKDSVKQPRITILLEAKGLIGSNPSLQPAIKVQTTISQRNLNVDY